jgi:antitoxin component YwqK of YwqJK toxin-antitoxin module
VKHRPFVRNYRNGQKLEEGSYRDGNRDGRWTYRNEDGSIDAGKSGVYPGDVRVFDPAPSPLGNYPVATDAPR